MGQCVSQSPRKLWQKKQMEEFISIDDFRLVKLIGKGGFSKVWKVQDKKSGQIYALKVMDKAKIITKKSVKAVLQERRILSRLMESGAQFIGGMYGSFQDKTSLYLLLDFMEGKSLRHHLNCNINLSETQIQWLVFAMLKALESLYRLHIIHRDIKPQNIIFDKEGIPYLIDFGAASYFQENNSDCNSGTPGYMSPEVMQSQDHTYTADYYAIGVLTFQLFFKRRPYSGTNSAELLKQIIKKPVNLKNFPELGSINSDACSFMTGLLQRKQRQRLGYNEGVTQLLKHPWLKSLDCNANIMIQLNHISPSLCDIEENLSIGLEEKSLSEETQQNEQKYSNMLHREHVQQMFSNFNSVPSSELLVPTRKRSFDTEKSELVCERRISLNIGQ